MNYIYHILRVLCFLLLLASPTIVVATDDFTPTPPRLGISIPGLTFSEATVTESGMASIPYLADYISAVYRYSIGVGTIIVAIIIIVSGLQIITSGGGNQLAAAKSRIVMSLVGLVLAWFSYVILFTINPNLIRFGELKIPIVPQIDLSSYIQNSTSRNANGTLNFTGEIDPNDHRHVPGERVTLTNEIIAQAGSNFPANFCLLYSTLKVESGNSLGLGNDANVPKSSSRLPFLRSGVKYSGERFSPTEERHSPIRNDDTYNFDAGPPYFGLDPRFSHGIGFGQYTIWGTLNQSTHEVRTVTTNQGVTRQEWGRFSSQNNRFYTITDLFNFDLALEASIGEIVRCINRRGEDNPQMFYGCYNGGDGSPVDSYPLFMGYYCGCASIYTNQCNVTTHPNCSNPLLTGESAFQSANRRALQNQIAIPDNTSCGVSTATNQETTTLTLPNDATVLMVGDSHFGNLTGNPGNTVPGRAIYDTILASDNISSVTIYGKDGSSPASWDGDPAPEIKDLIRTTNPDILFINLSNNMAGTGSPAGQITRFLDKAEEAFTDNNKPLRCYWVGMNPKSVVRYLTGERATEAGAAARTPESLRAQDERIRSAINNRCLFFAPMSTGIIYPDDQGGDGLHFSGNDTLRGIGRQLGEITANDFLSRATSAN
jgi:hypothetical protein